MKKFLFFMIVLGLTVLLVACSNDKSSSESSDKAMNTNEMAKEEGKSANVGTNDPASKQQGGKSKEDNAKSKEDGISQINRKIIYSANLVIEVKNFQRALDDIQDQVSKRGGYIVESNMYGAEEEGPKSGKITARIPQEKFREFIKFVEEGSSEVHESSISGQDVTEEYVDLESRLKSKHVVEKRLLSFMEQAKKTEDLLTISEDLAKVQGEIEEITGRMKYLQNKADLATVTIQMEENNVSVSSLNEDELNTWEKTKQQFLKSINFLITAFSGLIVFLVGNLPILIVLGLIGLAVFLVVRKSRKNNQG